MGFELQSFIETYLTSYGPLISYIVLFLIIFAETGLLIGFFLPGDSLLITAGLLASQGYIDIIPLIIILFLAAVIGDSVGYYIGDTYGRRLFKKENSLLFHKNHLITAKSFYDTHGGKTIILARFIPIIRTFAPVVAGMVCEHDPEHGLALSCQVRLLIMIIHVAAPGASMVT